MGPDRAIRLVQPVPAPGRQGLNTRRTWLPFCSTMALLLVIASSALSAMPRAWVEIDSTEVTIGDVVHATLNVAVAPSHRLVLPDLGADLPKLAVTFADSASTLLPEPTRRWTYKLQAFEISTHTIPELTVAAVSASGDTTRLTTEPVAFEVHSVLEEGEQELRDIKPPLLITGGIPVWLVALVVIAVVAVAVYLLARYLQSVSRGRVEPQPAVRPPTDYVREFTRIESMGLLQRGAHKEYYILLSDTLRRFLEEHCNFEAMECTTAEVQAALFRARGIREEGCGRIIRFLERADLVKFARAIPELEVAEGEPDIGREIVRVVLAELEAIRAADAAAEPVAGPVAQER
ncbi:MAG: hypothetical protein VX733_01180 [Candidatus Latescibacterota bacterium]|nr:hypothetical protein [Candidatus Latescibacterota bacterium]